MRQTNTWEPKSNLRHCMDLVRKFDSQSGPRDKRVGTGQGLEEGKSKRISCPQTQGMRVRIAVSSGMGMFHLGEISMARLYVTLNLLMHPACRAVTFSSFPMPGWEGGGSMTLGKMRGILVIPTSKSFFSVRGFRLDLFAHAASLCRSKQFLIMLLGRSARQFTSMLLARRSLVQYTQVRSPTVERA